LRDPNGTNADDTDAGEINDAGAPLPQPEPDYVNEAGEPVFLRTEEQRQQEHAELQEGGAEYTDPVNNPMIPHVIRTRPHHLQDLQRLLVLRSPLEELRQNLRAVTRKCRPDWDITTAELKAAWQQGRKELFYPYGKTYAQTIGEQD
jgi:hypothetical protein